MLDRAKGKSSADGVEGTALIRESERSGAALGQFSDFELINRVGSRTYRLKLEVRVAGREPYEVEADFKVPRKAENTGWSRDQIGKPLSPGLELPIRVDPIDPLSVEVDWDRFMAAPGRKDAQRATNASARNRALAQQLEKNPEQAEKLRANNRVAARTWAAAVRGGQMSREEFEQTVKLEVETGRMDPADADAARESLDD